MADNFTTERAQAILAIVRRYPGGATLRDIARDLPDAPGPRTLRSWAELIQIGGLVTVEGTGESTVVRVKTSEASPATAAPERTAGPTQAPLEDRKLATVMPATSATSAPPPTAAIPRSVVAGVADPGAPVAAVHDRGPSADTSPSGTPPAPTAPPATTAPNAGTEQMMQEAVEYVVGYGMVPEPATTMLRQMVRKEGLDGPAAAAFVERLLVVLKTLSETEAVDRYGLSAAQYNEWVEHCALAGYPRVAATGDDADAGVDDTPTMPVVAPPPAPSAVTVRDHPGVAPGVADAATSRSKPRTASQRAVATVRDRGEPSIAPTTHPPSATAAASPAMPTAPGMRQPGSSRAAAMPRALTTASWVLALLSAGTGLYQFRSHLPFASVAASPPPGAPGPGAFPGVPGSPSSGGPGPTPAPPPDANQPATPPGSVSGASVPGLPAGTGAYVLSGARWVPLPRNNSQVLTIDDGRPMPAGAVGLLMFSGAEPPPRVPPDAVVAYVGAPGWTSAELARYPALRDERAYPPVELALLARDESGVRSAWWSELLPGVTGIGERRVAATLEHPAANVILVRPLAPLAPGPYAVSSGARSFEFTVE